MNSQIKAIYITKNKSIDIWETVSHNGEPTIWFLYHEFIDQYLSKSTTFRGYIDSVVESFEEKVPNCGIIFIEPSDDYIINKFNEYLIERLKDTNIKVEYIEPVNTVDFRPVENGKFVNE